MKEGCWLSTYVKSCCLQARRITLTSCGSAQDLGCQTYLAFLGTLLPRKFFGSALKDDD
jgi:hypothetical protein